MRNSTLGLEILIQLCRLRIRSQREKYKMTPKMRGALESLRKMQHHADEQAEKLTTRIEREVLPKMNEGFKKAHGRIDDMSKVVDDMDKFADDLMRSNGGDPLDDSEDQSSKSPPRSSEVASK